MTGLVAFWGTDVAAAAVVGRGLATRGLSLEYTQAPRWDLSKLSSAQAAEQGANSRIMQWAKRRIDDIQQGRAIARFYPDFLCWVIHGTVTNGIAHNRRLNEWAG